jgi:hypothetical protein
LVEEGGEDDGGEVDEDKVGGDGGEDGDGFGG